MLQFLAVVLIQTCIYVFLFCFIFQYHSHYTSSDLHIREICSRIMEKLSREKMNRRSMVEQGAIESIAAICDINYQEVLRLHALTNEQRAYGNVDEQVRIPMHMYC